MRQSGSSMTFRTLLQRFSTTCMSTVLIFRQLLLQSIQRYLSTYVHGVQIVQITFKELTGMEWPLFLLQEWGQIEERHDLYGETKVTFHKLVY